MMMLPMMALAQTLEECQLAAERNYPLIKQYGLIEKTTELTVANIQKGWLPQVSASAQATYQSDVVAFPDQMQAIYQQMGLDMKGLTKDQYRVGIDVSQTVYDGGAISSQKRIAREQGKVQTAQNEVNIYNVRKRVNEMYFALLMLDEQMKLNQDLQELLSGNERKLASMVKNGTAAESDWQNVKAERLNVMQQATNLEGHKADDTEDAEHVLRDRGEAVVEATFDSSRLWRGKSPAGAEGAGCADRALQCAGEGAGRGADAEAGCVCARVLRLSGTEYV